LCCTLDGDSTCGDTLCFDLCAGNGSTIIKDGGKAVDKRIADPYPNPVNTTLFVPVRTEKGEVAISVIGIDGKRLQSNSIQVATGDQKIELSIKDLPTGTYMLEIIEDGARRVKTISRL